MAAKLTIRDIARLAGVSTTTVSRVLNQKPDVDPATRERILKIMEEQSYVPNAIASGLAGGHSWLIGVLVPSLTWPFMPEILRGIAGIVEQTPYEIVLYSVTHAQDRRQVIDRIVASKLIAGLIAVFPDGTENRPYALQGAQGQATRHLVRVYKRGLPTVIVDDLGLPANLPWVGVDNRAGAYEAVRHLIRLGHRRIGCIRGPLEYQGSHDRYQGYCQALAEAGLAPDPAFVLEGDFATSGGHECASRFFAMTERPTAIFASNDQMAYGVMAAAEEWGLRIPDDVALVGFDDIALSAHLRPALTTVRQPFDAMGQRAAELVLSLVESLRLAGNSYLAGTRGVCAASMPDEPIRIQLATSLVVRESCGAFRQVTAPAPEL
jgi:LacI family transcriptional regulator